jgi:hypothetical protein
VLPSKQQRDEQPRNLIVSCAPPTMHIAVAGVNQDLGGARRRWQQGR